MKFIVGLTGGIASGKSTVSSYLASLGAYVVDADIIAREVVLPGSQVVQSIADLLGEEYLLADGHLNRVKIKQLIFNQPEIKKSYEAIILPAIRDILLIRCANTPVDNTYCLCVVPLLFEKNFDQYVDYVVCVDISVSEQIRRACQRNPNDSKVIQQVIMAQMPREERVNRSDYVIDNSQSINQLHQQIETLHQSLCQLAVEKE